MHGYPSKLRACPSAGYLSVFDSSLLWVMVTPQIDLTACGMVGDGIGNAVE